MSLLHSSEEKGKMCPHVQTLSRAALESFTFISLIFKEQKIFFQKSQVLCCSTFLYVHK